MKLLVIKYFTKALLCILSLNAHTQHIITGKFPNLAGQQINLVGFEGFNSHTINSVQANDKGSFKLTYCVKDYGMGYLAAEDNKHL